MKTKELHNLSANEYQEIGEELIWDYKVGEVVEFCESGQIGKITGFDRGLLRFEQGIHIKRLTDNAEVCVHPLDIIRKQTEK